MNPVAYDSGIFTYEIHDKWAFLTGLSENLETDACKVPKKVRGIPVIRMFDGALQGNSKLRRITFSKDIPNLSPGLCKGCKSLKSFKLGLNTIRIGVESFADCTNLGSVVAKDGLRYIESRAFAGCTSLTKVELSPRVTHIADDAFEGCHSAVFYCDKGTYARQWAKDHGFKTANMTIYRLKRKARRLKKKLAGK